MYQQSKPMRLIRRREVEQKTGKSRSAIYAAIANGEFPNSVPIGGHSVAWLESEIDEWITDKIRAGTLPPRGTLQDAGEVAVLTRNAGETHHRYAMVIAFDNEEALRQAVNNHSCVYRDSQTVEELNHG